MNQNCKEHIIAVRNICDVSGNYPRQKANMLAKMDFSVQWRKCATIMGGKNTSLISKGQLLLPLRDAPSDEDCY